MRKPSKLDMYYKAEAKSAALNQASMDMVKCKANPLYSMRQAIVVKYLGPTNSKGDRLKASTRAGSLTIPWHYGSSPEANHRYAMTMLREKLGWVEPLYGTEHGAWLPNGNSVWVID